MIFVCCGVTWRGGVATLCMQIKKIKTTFDTAIQRLEWIESELREISFILRDIQPRRNGIVTLCFVTCGKNCATCPSHLKFLKWTMRNDGTMVSRVARQPLRSVSRVGKLREIADSIYNLIRRAQQLEKERAAIMRHVGNLARSNAVYSGKN